MKISQAAKITRALTVTALLALASCSSGFASDDTTSTGEVSVVILDGFDTDPADAGRPIVLIAAALDVPAETFRTAFSAVHPADPNVGPDGAQAAENKQALLNVLGPWGITNDRLDEVSDHYRYNRGDGQSWPQETAEATATVVDGVVTGFVVTDAGSGYTSVPTIVVSGADVRGDIAVDIHYDAHFASNGSIESIMLSGADPSVRQ